MAGVGGHYIGRSVERLGPIGSASASTEAILVESGIALVCGALGVIVHKRRRSVETAPIVGTIVWVAIVAGTYFAFNAFAGSRDCPGTQDCDTLIVPVLFPYVVAAAVGAFVGAASVVGAFAATRRLRG